jgi:hypothetical protein
MKIGMKLARRIAIVTAVAATLAAAVGAFVSPAARQAGRTLPGCASSGLVVWLDTQGNGAAGSIYYKLELTNLSGRACTLAGYPGVSAVDLRGRQLGRAAARNATLVKPAVVRLANGATATATLRITDTGVFSPSACRSVTAAGLRVYPPNQTRARVVPFPFNACSRSGPVYLRIAPVEKA